MTESFKAGLLLFPAAAKGLTYLVVTSIACEHATLCAHIHTHRTHLSVPT